MAELEQLYKKEKSKIDPDCCASVIHSNSPCLGLLTSEVVQLVVQFKGLFTFSTKTLNFG